MEEDVAKTVIKTLRTYLNDELPLDKDFIRELDRRKFLASNKASMLVALVDQGDTDCIHQLVTYMEQFYTEEKLLKLCAFLEEYAQPARPKLAIIACKIRQEILKHKPQVPLPVPEDTLHRSAGVHDDEEVLLRPRITPPLKEEFSRLVAEVFCEIKKLNDEKVEKLHTFLSVLLAPSCVPETVDKMKKYLLPRLHELDPELLEAIVQHIVNDKLTEMMTHYQQSLSKELTTSLGECSTELAQTVITSEESLVSVKIDRNLDQQTLGDVFSFKSIFCSLRIACPMFRGFKPGCIVLFFSIPTECVWSLPSCLLPSNLSLLEEWKVISLSVKGAFTVDIKERIIVDSFNKHSLLSSTSEYKALNEHLEARNVDLQTRNDDLQTRNDDLQTRNDDLQIREKAMVDEFDVSNNYLQHFQSYNADLKTRNDDLQTRNDDLKTCNDGLQIVIANLQTCNDNDLQTHVKDLQTRNDDLQTRNVDLQTRNDKLQTHNVSLQTCNDDLQTSNNDALQTLNKDLQTLNDDLKDEVSTLKEVLQQTRNRVNTKEDELLALKRKLSEENKLNLDWIWQEPGPLEDLWKPGAPEELWEPTAVCVKDKIFICDKCYSWGWQDCLHIFNVSKREWSKKPQRFHESREMSRITLATTNNQVHCLGGDWKKDGKVGQYSKIVFTLDCDSLQWSDNTLPPLNIGRVAAASTSFESIIVVAGGWDEDGQWLSSVEVLNSSQQYSTWWNICELSVRPEKIMCTVSDTDLFVGCDGGDTNRGRTLYSCKLSAVKEAMIPGDSTSSESFWHVLPVAPLSQSGLGVVNNCLISVGGEDDCGGNSTAVYLYESCKKTWTNLESTQISKSRLYPAVVPCSIENRHELFVLGGCAGSDTIESCPNIRFK